MQKTSEVTASLHRPCHGGCIDFLGPILTKALTSTNFKTLHIGDGPGLDALVLCVLVGGHGVLVSCYQEGGGSCPGSLTDGPV